MDFFPPLKKKTKTKHWARLVSFMSGPSLSSSFFPRGDVCDLDQSCLSTSAVHKGPRSKLFTLTSFRENKPCSLGASVPPRGARKNASPRRPAAVSPWARPPGPGSRAPVTGAVGPERDVQVLWTMSELHVLFHGTTKITPPQWRVFMSQLSSGKKSHDIMLSVI